MSPPASTGSLRRGPRKPGASGTRRPVWYLLLAVGALLAIVGAWTYHAVQETVHDELTESLQTILQANIEALQIVVQNERGHIQAWAKDAEIRELTQQLLAGHEAEDQAQRELTAVLANVLAEDGYLGYAVIDPDGIIRATDQPDPYLGKKLSPTAMELLAPILSGESSFEKPFPKHTLFSDPSSAGNRPVLLAKAPIPDIDGKIIAALVFTIDPEKDFTRILSVARFGQTGSTYAFDERGVMLSESRHEQQLKELGLIPDQPEATAILTLQLRDPGVDLTRGRTTDTPIAARPLTRMAAMAANGRPGIDVDGYRDYRGVEVVGAWQWLAEYGFGVATEVERSEALRPLRPVRLAFIGLFGLLVLTAGGFLGTSYFIGRLQSEIDELRELGQYTLVEKIGEGGMGKVYKASHDLLRRPTAIKLIRENQLSEKALERFEQEVQITSQLTHPNTISIYDYGHSPDGVFYYAMEYLSGIDLGQLVRIEPQLPAERVIYILSQVCGSLAEAHGQGLIHRDIKPGNVMLCQRGGAYDFVKLLDFGLVREITPREGADLAQHEIMGTPGFIAPELLVIEKQVDERADLYAVGALGFLMLTGQQPFGDRGTDTMLHAIVNSDPPKPSQRTDRPVPESLDMLIHACLSRAPELRPASAGELGERLSAIKIEKSWTHREAKAWWQDNAERVACERKIGRPEAGDVSETVIDIDFGDRN